MRKKELLYDGKEKQLYATDNPNQIIILYKDDASAYNGVKRTTIKNKGIINNRITELLYKELEKNGIRTHFLERLDPHNQLCQKTTIIPLEFIVRNVIAGSLTRRLDLDEGTIPENTIFEICLKNDELRDPLINDHHAVAMKIVSYEELRILYDIVSKINQVLVKLFQKIGVIVVDFKVEFGYDENHSILLADEISPDSARFWDADSKESLDKDRFRRDLGKVEESYTEILNRLENLLAK